MCFGSAIDKLSEGVLGTLSWRKKPMGRYVSTPKAGLEFKVGRTCCFNLRRLVHLWQGQVAERAISNKTFLFR